MNSEAIAESSHYYITRFLGSHAHTYPNWGHMKISNRNITVLSVSD